MRQSLVILGGPGDGMVALECVRQMAAVGVPIHTAGFLNDTLAQGTLLDGVPVLGTLDSWRQLPEEYQFFPALHKIRAMPQRAERILALGIPCERWATLIHPTALVAQGVAPGHGSFVGPYVVIQPQSRLDNFLSLRAGANVGHDCVVEDFAYMGPNSVLCGRARLQKGAHLAPCAVVGDNVSVGAFSIVGASSAASRSVPAYVLVMGNPARVVEHLVPQEFVA